MGEHGWELWESREAGVSVGSGGGLPLGLEMLCFSGKGRSAWVTVHVNCSPERHCSSHTLALPVALKVALG